MYIIFMIIYKLLNTILYENISVKLLNIHLRA
jgi:hypothetical protein